MPTIAAWTLFAALANPADDLDLPPPPPAAPPKAASPLPKPPEISATTAPPPPVPVKKLPAPEAVAMPTPLEPRTSVALSKPKPLGAVARSPAEPPPAAPAPAPAKSIPAPVPEPRVVNGQIVVARSTDLPASAPPAPKPAPAAPIRRVAASGETGGVVAAIAPADAVPASVEPAIELVERPAPRYQIVQIGHDAEDRRLDPGKGPPKKISYAPAPEVNSYTIEFWDVDGWETFAALARQRYRAADYGPALAKYNRWTGRLDAALPRGLRLKLPPSATLDKIAGVPVADRSAAASGPGERGFLLPAEEAEPLLKGVAVASSRPLPNAAAGPPRTAVVAADPRPPAGLKSPARSDATTTVAAPLRTPLDREYVVEEARTTLFMVAQRQLGDAKYKDELYRLNQNVLSSPDDVLRIGTRLRLPDDVPLRR